MSKLTEKQEMFCAEYIIDFNGARAAEDAGYSPKSARVTASKLLTKGNIQKRIASLMAQRMEEVEVDAKYVLRRLVEIDRMDIGDIINENGAIKPIHEWSEVWRRTIASFDVTEIFADGDPVGVLKKIKIPDKLKNLELLGKHVDVSAFREKTDITITGNPVEEIMQYLKDGGSDGFEE